MNRQILIPVFILIISAFVLISAIGLNWGFQESNYNAFNPDEVTHAETAKSFLNFEKPPTFYVKFYALQEALIGLVLGANEIHELVYIGRHLSLVYAILTLILVFIIGKKYFGENASLISTIILGSSLLFVTWSHQATPIMASLFWFLLSLYLINLSFERKEFLLDFLAIISVAFCFATQFVFIPILLLLLSFLFRSEWNYKKKIIAFVFFAFVFTGAFWLASGSLISIEDLLHTFNVVKLRGLEVIQDKSNWINFSLIPIGLAAGMSFFVLVFSTLGLLLVKKKNFQLFFILPTIGYIIFLINKSILLERYLLLLFPVIAISFGYYSSIILQKKPKYFLIPIVIILLTLIPAVGAQLEQQNDNRYVAYEWIEENVKPEETFIASKYFYESSEYKHDLNLSQKPEYVFLHELYFARYIKKFVTGAKEPRCNTGIHHQTSESNCLVVKGLVNGTNSDYYLLKEFDYPVYSIEGFVFKKSYGMFDVQTGKVLIFKKN